MDTQNSSGVDTVLIVILLIVVGAPMRFFRGGFASQGGQNEDKSLKVDVTVPTEQ